MLKKISIVLTVLMVLTVGAGIGAYYFARGHLKQWVALAQQAAAEKGMRIVAKTVEVPSSGLAVNLRDASFAGDGVPYEAAAENISAGLEWSWSKPWVQLRLTVHHPKLSESAKKAPPPSTASKKSSPQEHPIQFLGALSKFCGVRVEVEGAELAPFGISGLDTRLILSDLGFTKMGQPTANVSHSVSIKSISSLPGITGISTKGESEFDGTSLVLKQGTLGAGPFRFDLKGKLNTNDLTWSADAKVPNTNFSSEKMSSPVPWLNSVSGVLGVEIAAKGKAGDVALLEGEGKIKAKQLAIDLKHEMVTGNLTSEMDLTFKKQKTLSLKGNFSSSLTGAELKAGENFLKPKGVALEIQGELDGENDIIKITKSHGTFHNLNFGGSGEVTLGDNPKGQIRANIAPTDLAGWEKFFPKYSNVKARGTIQANLSFKGPLKEWKSAEADAELKATDVTAPILKGWIPVKDLDVDGVAAFNTATKVSFGQGELRTFSTSTRIDLSDGNVGYKDLFHKKRGTPLAAALSITSTGKKATIKEGGLVLGSIRAAAKGSIENFSDPQANFSFSTNAIALSDVLAMTPSVKPAALSSLSGNVTVSGKMTGPLLAKAKFPEVNGEVKLNKISLNYQLETPKKKIILKQLSGPVQFTTRSASSSKLTFSFPGTEGWTSFRASLPAKPDQKTDISLNVQTSKFALNDFMDPPKNGGTPGLVMVPAVPVQMAGKGGSTKKEDFRENPTVKSLKFNGNVTLNNANLGYAKAEWLKASIKFDNLALSIDPFVIKTWGGTFTSTTDWNGKTAVPTGKVTLRTAGVDANQFLAQWSEDMRNIVVGKLNSNFAFQFAGMTPEEIKKSVKGNGDFGLIDGQVKSLKLTEKPLEALKKLPGLGNGIRQTSWDEKLSEITGKFSVADGKIKVSDLIMRSSLFDVTGTETTIDFDLAVNAKVTLFPKETLLAASSLDALKDDSGKPSLSLTVTGPLKSPSVGIDMGPLQDRIAKYATRKIAEEAKKKAQGEIENKVKEGLGNLFK